MGAIEFIPFPTIMQLRPRRKQDGPVLLFVMMSQLGTDLDSSGEEGTKEHGYLPLLDDLGGHDPTLRVMLM